ncbi:MAG: DNA-processing protein DprA [Clostridiales bacterium]|nr:DNA-processing protein DprA [Clostridiales bacterium]
MKENFYWVWLSSLPHIGVLKKKKLIDEFGSPYKIFYADVLQLRELSYLTSKNIDALINRDYREQAKVHLENVYKNDIKIITLDDEAYPKLLKNIYDPPIVLYIKGKIKKDDVGIGIVGARRATQYGLNIAYDMGDNISQCGVTVISGLARGIDTYAHKGALKNGGRTIAVLGSGLDVVYPYENKELFENIQKDGMVITEYLPKTKPSPYNFPARNRIISGLSRGILVVEAGIKSGSLITADFALEQGRDVFAIPGNIGYKNSEGTNTLIKEGAKLVTCARDILEDIGYIAVKKISENSNKYKNLNELEKSIIECLKEKNMCVDEMVKYTSMELKSINASLLVLELRGMIRKDDKNVYRVL